MSKFLQYQLSLSITYPVTVHYGSRTLCRLLRVVRQLLAQAV